VSDSPKVPIAEDLRDRHANILVEAADNHGEFISDEEQEVFRLIERISRAEAALEALQWTPISETNLPKGHPHDEVLHRHGYTGTLGGRYEGYTYEEMQKLGWTHFRPINPPRIEDGGK
jgi:hypothetical protein